MLSVIYKHLMLSVVVLNVVMLSVISLSVTVPILMQKPSLVCTTADRIKPICCHTAQGAKVSIVDGCKACVFTDKTSLM
jgi:hypothetical protein